MTRDEYDSLDPVVRKQTKISARYGNLSYDLCTRAAILLRQVPGRITSSYRTPNENAACGGATRSQHLYGRALDIVFPGQQLKMAYLIAHELFAGIGVSRHGNMIHVDVRPSNHAEWYYIQGGGYKPLTAPILSSWGWSVTGGNGGRQAPAPVTSIRPTPAPSRVQIASNGDLLWLAVWAAVFVMIALLV